MIMQMLDLQVVHFKAGSVIQLERKGCNNMNKKTMTLNEVGAKPKDSSIACKNK